MNDFKQGDMVEVSNYRGFPRLKTFKREFVWMNGNLTYCIDHADPGFLRDWVYIRAIKEPEYIEYTQETLPKGSLWFKSIDERDGSIYPAGTILTSGVIIGGQHLTWESMLVEYEISEDGRRTWKPCGELN